MNWSSDTWVRREKSAASCYWLMPPPHDLVQNRDAEAASLHYLNHAELQNSHDFIHRCAGLKRAGEATGLWYLTTGSLAATTSCLPAPPAEKARLCNAGVDRIAARFAGEPCAEQLCPIVFQEGDMREGTRKAMKILFVVFANP
jgi:hypothetical protein